MIEKRHYAGLFLLSAAMLILEDRPVAEVTLLVLLAQVTIIAAVLILLH